MTYEKFTQQFHIYLTEQQNEAVQAVDGPVLLLSVPGSGKTTVLVTRIAWMIYGCGISPETILVLTYTVAAAHDMARRFSEKFGEDLGRRIHFSTINSICHQIIHWYAAKTGNRVFTFSDYSPIQAAYLRQAYTKVGGGYPTESEIQGVRSSITFIKNMMLGNDEIEALRDELDFDIGKIYKGYRSFMRSHQLMDYDDQLTYAYTILAHDMRAMDHLHESFSYVLIDEAQDTSKIQHLIIAMIARQGNQDNLFMVGDEDQSIYGFRGAYPEALMSFKDNHPGARVLLMEKNFRSDANIVNAASNVISHNVLRHEKKMSASHDAVIPVRKVELVSRGAQLSYLLKMAQDLHEETAILYRDNESIIPFVDLLEKTGTPYRMRQSEMNFFTSRVVKDITDIIHFAYDSYDTNAFMNIYYKVRMYLKKENAKALCGVSEAESIPVLDAAWDSSILTRRQKETLDDIDLQFKSLRKMTGNKGLIYILYSMGYLEYMERTGLDTSRLFALKKISEDTPDLQGFLKRLDYLNETIANKENDSSVPLILSTIHSSKGLEYDNVYLIDVMDGVFPKDEIPPKISDPKQVTPEQEAFEEERRIFYVGVTRARKRLTIFTFQKEKSIFSKELSG